MPSDRRDLISDLYHRALARAPEERAAFLIEACHGDEALREEVESLLEFEPASARLLERPAVDVAAGAGGISKIDRRLGPYTIVAPLGAGGMGEVYRARDSKLGRDVAVKILPAHFTADPERRARFAREARLLATLNHPHIGAIYGLEETDGVTALILELVEGPTLADHIGRQPMRIVEVIAIARQIADALDAAHEKGIVHRDLKPANIVLQRDTNASGVPSGVAHVKVLDFGLAKLLPVEAGGGPFQDRPTFDGTADGRILGTPAYMSPEQARGQPVDKRTDIWAFGCVLFAMLTGRPAFDGETISDTLVSVLDREPDWAALPAVTPERIRDLLRRCLQKDLQKRLRDIADASLDIGDSEPARAAGPYANTQENSSGRRRRGARLTEIAAAFIIGALLVGGTLRLWDRPAAVAGGDSLQFAFGPPPSTVFPFQNFGFAIAPDGRRLAMVAFADNTLSLWVRSFGSGESRRLRGTERARNPFWSPDSRQVAFFAGGKLKTVGLNGEAPFDVCDVTAGEGGAGGTWNSSGSILLGSLAGPLLRVTSTGGTPTAVTALKEADTSHRYPWFLPDGDHFLFLAIGKGAPQLRVGSLSSTDSTPLGSIRSNAAYAAGHLLFVQGGLVAQRFDPGSRELMGEPFPLNDQMALMGGRGAFSLSETGLLGYSAGPPRALARLTWMDRHGTPIEPVGEYDSYFDLALSTDDRRVAISSESDGNIDIWVIDFSRPGDKKRITSDAGLEFHPDWSPDGAHLSFTSNRTGVNKVFRRPSDGSGSDEVLVEGSGAAQSVWSPLGKSLIYRAPGEEALDLWTQSLEDGGKSSVFVPTPFAEHSPVFSPDGRWIAYSSDRTGRPEIYIRPFPSKDPEHKVSLGGGKMPRWRTDGEIFFLSLEGMLMSARFNAATNPPTAIPQRLFQTGLAQKPIWNRPYDVTRNGQRFLIPVSRDLPDERLITIVTNWTAKLGK